MRIEPGRLTCPRATLQVMIEAAYQIQPYQVAGGPDWLKVDRYSVSAKAGSPVDRNQIMLMLRALLAERFKLSFHNETREIPAFALVVWEDGDATLTATGNSSYSIKAQFREALGTGAGRDCT